MEMVQVRSDYERERGKPMPSWNHSLTEYRLIKAFSRHDDEFFILPELSLDLGSSPLVPDISVYARVGVDPSTLPTWSEDRIKMKEPPLTAVEILSPTQSLDELIKKATAYHAAGVRSCWIVQPALGTIAILEPDKRPKTYTDGEVTDPATGIRVRLEEIFPV